MSLTTHSPSASPTPPPSGGHAGHPGRGRGGSGRGPGGPGGLGGPRPATVDPADRAQLDESPVSWRRVAALFTPYRGQIALVMTLIVGTSLLGTVSPFLVRDIVDQAIPRQDVRLLLLAVGGLVAITVVTQLFGVLQTWISSRVGQRLMHGLRTRVFDHLQGQSLGFFTRTRGGEVQSRLTNDIAGMQSVITETATSIASNVTTAIATAVAMAALSWRLSLLSLVVIPPAIWLTRRVALLRRDLTTRLQRRLAELNGIVDETLSVSGARLTKTLGIGDRRSAEFAATSAALVDLELASQLAGRWRMATMQIIFALIPAAIYLVAGLPATSGGMTIGTLVAFTALQSSIFRPLMGLLNTGAQWVTSMALFSRIFGYLDLEIDVPEPRHPVPLPRETARGAVRFDDVSFRYPGSHVDALHDVSVDVPAGTTLALVGETGSGKSTFAALVSRLYDPTLGRVTIDGIDVRDLSSADLAALVGVVSQETYLVHGSIADNLRLARPDASDTDLWRALEVAQIDDVVATLPDGLQTLVGARGYRFSGGEQQRLAIARTVLRNPRILVLDEATSALDNDTERELQAALDALVVGRTTIVIAHRLSTVRDADQIVVLDHGAVLERGTHDTLVAAQGRYAGLAAR